MNGAETQLPLSKRLLAVLFALVLVVGMAPVSAWAEGEGNAQDSANTQQTDNELNNENSTDVTGGGESSDNADQAGTEPADTAGEEVSLVNESGENGIAVASFYPTNPISGTAAKEFQGSISNSTVYSTLNSKWGAKLGLIPYYVDGTKITSSSAGDFVLKNAGTSTYTVQYKLLNWMIDLGTLKLTEIPTVTSASEFTYDGNSHKPVLKNYEGNELAEGADYDATYKRNGQVTTDFTNAGTIDVSITAKNGYTGTFNFSYTIVPAKVTVSVVGNSDELTYNGSEQSVEGFEVTGVEGDAKEYFKKDSVELKESGSAKVSGTNASAEPYKMGLTGDSFTCTDKNFNVKYEVTDGSLTIDPAEVTVSVEGNTKTATYSGQEQSVEGFKVIGVKGDDALEYFDYESVLPAESASAKAVGTDAGTYKMGLNEDSFTCTDKNFKVVEYLVTDGSLTINKRVIEASNSASVVYNGQEQVLNITEANATGLVEGDELYLKNAQVKGTEPGTYTDVTEYDWTVISGNLIVTNNYDLKLSGELTITKADSGSGSAADNGNTGKADQTDKAKTSSASPQTGDSIAPFAMAAGIIAIAAALAAFFVSRKLRGTTRR